MLPAVEVSATPKLLAGVVTQPCTREVMSRMTNCWATVGVKVVVTVPIEGLVV